LQIREDSADIKFNILADWMAALKKARKPNFEQIIVTLRAHGFDVAPSTEFAGVLVSKHGAAAVLTATAPVSFAVSPGVLVGGRVARLLDRGHQKFIKTPQLELPATASHLHAIHQFSEELKLLTGDIDLYNESLGTTSDVYLYDRLKGREGIQPPN
jgi:hypothetical protein